MAVAIGLLAALLAMLRLRLGDDSDDPVRGGTLIDAEDQAPPILNPLWRTARRWPPSTSSEHPPEPAHQR